MSKVVILCGGLGTRMREETEFRPKPMVDIGGRPILWHIMRQYGHFGFNEFVLCLGYKGHMIKEYFLNYEAMTSDFTISLGDRQQVAYHGPHPEQRFRVTLADTGDNTMTGGRIQAIEQYVDGDTFLVTYGDGLADVNIGAVLRFHREHGKIATVTAVRPISRYGLLTVADDGQVTDFAEKPNLEGWINAGFFVFQREIFRYLSGNQCVLEREPLERLCREGQLAAFRHEGYFYAMDTYREYKHLNDIWTAGRAPWKVWT
ncbi:MAG: glucose-1-phosphate cytidylyltransferase [Pirellulaceae bacterium]|nr:glucose-1-phosphate cytidylyltransferase [Pirellulaceae bacterium]